MATDLLLIAGGLALLFLGAEALVRGAAALALRLGLSALLVGLTVVAFGTSAPELVVSIQASLGGAGGIAVGNVIGSNIANIALILGVSALVRPLQVKAQIIRLDLPLMIVASVILGGVLLDRSVSRIEGGLLFAGLVAYITFTYLGARRAKASVEVDVREGLPPAEGSLLLQLGLVAVGLGMLVFGANWLVQGAVSIAEAAGLSETVIGLTLVAVGTSLPELATSIVAVARGADDLAVGNVVGSNLFNILGILGLAALVHPITAPSLGFISLGVMVGVALLALPLSRTGFVLNRTEGALFVLTYGAYVGYLVVF